MNKILKMMTVIASLLFALGNAYANDKQCKIEDWRWMQDRCWIEIEGSTTCSFGVVRMRLYDKQDKFLGVSGGLVRGYSFSIIAGDICSTLKSLRIRYTFEELQQ